jgi:cell division protein YceG involved in septum cleavage
LFIAGPDEDKVSGSILLPSYKISPTTKDDNVFKKFAFKAEHQNMRTYYFAAETKESMLQWMNALSLASILQQDPK